MNNNIDNFRDSARAYLRRSNCSQRLRQLRVAPIPYERVRWKEMADAGWFGINIPESAGGLGLGLGELCAVAQETGAHLLPEPFAQAAVQPATLLAALPPSPLVSQLLADVLSGEKIIAVAWQERLGELEPAGMRTTSRGNERHHTLDGAKLGVSPGACDGWIVAAQAGAELALYWVPAGTPDIEAEPRRQVDGSTCASLVLRQARLPASHRLALGAQAGEALRIANDTLRLAQGAELVGVARQALDLALEYLRTRVQFGRAIGSFQALQHQAADALLQVELAAACLDENLQKLAAGATPLPLAASRAKARCAQAAMVVTQFALHIHGAMGYTDECDVGLYLKRAIATAAHMGNVEAHRRRHRELAAGAIEERAQSRAWTGDAFPQDADWSRMTEPDFRAMIRAFLQQHYPEPLRNMPHRVRWATIRDWTLTLARQGWLAPAWPKAHGGMGLPPDKLIAYIEEFEDHGVARAPDQGVVMIGPLLIQHGTPRQQQDFLPRILAGEHIWCQGYSEPNAGSDLASLRTSAAPDPEDADMLVVNGQKIWCTLAQDATHIFALVRTDHSGPRQTGISFLLIELATPGITVRPIRDILGVEEFNEVFFDNVRVPRANLVGRINDGWTIAKALLGFERIYVGSPKQSRYVFSKLAGLARARGLLQDEAFAARYGELQLDIEDLGAFYSHFVEIFKRGEPIPASISLLKIWATETYQKASRLLLAAAAEAGGCLGNSDYDGLRLDALALFFNAIPSTIYAGSNEVQRNIVAKQVLRLPAH